MVAEQEAERERSAGRGGRRPRLGQLLLDRGWINGEQLIRAVQSQRAVGGRIGTCLLEMDALSEDRLLDALAAQLGVPPIRIDQLRTIGQEVLRLVPSTLAVRYRAVPFEVSKSQVRIAALDVHDLARLDEIAFCAGRKVLAHIANEARLYEALERYYRVECPQRYGHLLDRLNRARYLWRASDGVTADSWGDHPFAPPSVDWVRPDDHFGPLAELEPPRVVPPDLVDADAGPAPAASPPEVPAAAEGPPDAAELDAARTDDGAPAAEATPVEAEPAALADPGLPPLAPPRSLPQVAADLAGQSDAHGVAGVLLSFLAGPFVRCGLLRAEHGKLRGWHAFGPGLDHDRFTELRLAPELLASATADRSPEAMRVGEVTVGAVDPTVTACWRGVDDGPWIVAPVVLKNRMVCAILGHREGRPAPERLLLQLNDLSRRAALALELCILRRKLVGSDEAAAVDLTPPGDGH